MEAVLHAAVPDRTRANTWAAVNDRLDADTQHRLRRAAAASPGELTRHIEWLERQWNFDRVVEAEASLVGFMGLALGLAVDRRFLLMPAFAASMVILHATQGWYPLLPLFRRLGIRTQDEIDRERYAIKAMRGDFTHIPPPGHAAAERAVAAWRAVCA